jgi:serine protein kinase
MTTLLDDYRSNYSATQEAELTLEEYLALCKRDRGAYASAAERMLAGIGDPELVDTRNDQRLGRIFGNRVIRRYPAFREFYGMEDAIEQIVAFFKHAAQGLEERKQILYLLGPVGGGKSSIAERLKTVMERRPIYAIKGSPVNESPLGLFAPERFGSALEADYGIPRRYLNGIMSPWAIKRLEEFGGDISRFRVVRLTPSVLRQVAITRPSPATNNQDISSLVGRSTSASWRACRRTTPTPTVIQAACASPTRDCSSSSRCSRRPSRCCTRC